MKRNSFLLVLTGLIVLLVLLIAVFVYALWGEYFSTERPFASFFSDTKASLDNEDYDKTRQELLSLARRSLLDHEWEQALSLSYRFSRKVENYSTLEILASKALEEYPTHPKFWTYLAYAALRSHRYLDVLEISEKHSLDSRLGAIAREAWLRHFKTTAHRVSLIEYISQQTSPQVFFHLAEAISQSHFYYTASLLYFAQGNLSAAKDAFSRIEEPQNYHFFYPNLIGEVQKNYLKLHQDFVEQGPSNDPWELLWRAEVYYLMGQNNDAETLYLHLIENFPQFNVIPYINLSTIYQNSSRQDDVYLTLQKGFPYFYDNDVFLWHWSMYLLSIGLTEEVWNFFQRNQYDIPKNVPTKKSPWKELTLLKIESQNLSKEAFRARLWEMHHQINDKPSAYFSQESLSELLLQSLEDLEKLLIFLEKDYAHRSWYKIYRNFLLHKKGNSSINTQENFEEIGRLYQSYEAYYNAGSIALSLKQYERARKNFLLAYKLFPYKEKGYGNLSHVEKQVLSEISLRISLSYSNDEGMQESRFWIERALSWDETNSLARIYHESVFSSTPR